jgi:hypothetical protein
MEPMVTIALRAARKAGDLIVPVISCAAFRIIAYQLPV